MDATDWSWILGALGILGIWLIGDGRRVGYLFGIFAQLAWMADALLTKQYGFIVTSIAYGYVYTRGYQKADRRAAEEVGGSNR